MLSRPIVSQLIFSFLLSMQFIGCKDRTAPEYIYGKRFNNERISLCIPIIETGMRFMHFKDSNNFLFAYGPLNTLNKGYHSSKWIKLKDGKIFEEEDTFYASVEKGEGWFLRLTYNYIHKSFYAEADYYYWGHATDMRTPILKLSLFQVDSVLNRWGLSRCPSSKK